MKDLMESLLEEMSTASSKKKVKPIVNVHTYEGAKPSNNNTAFYFKTEKYYYFVSVEADNVHLGVKKTPTSSHTNESYLKYLTFQNIPLDKCPRDKEGLEAVDAPAPVRKTAISTSPLSDIERRESLKKSSVSSPDSTPSDAFSPSERFKFDGDSGVDAWSKDSGDDNMISPSTETQATANLPAQVEV